MLSSVDSTVIPFRQPVWACGELEIRSTVHCARRSRHMHRMRTFTPLSSSRSLLWNPLAICTNPLAAERSINLNQHLDCSFSLFYIFVTCLLGWFLFYKMKDCYFWQCYIYRKHESTVPQYTAWTIRHCFCENTIFERLYLFKIYVKICKI